MPFEFTGESPSLGSTSDAFKPLSFRASSTATPLRTLCFGGSSSFGSSTVSRPSSFANAFASAPSLQTTLLTSSPFTSLDEDTKKASSNVCAKLSSHNDSLSRALHRANLARPAIIGDSEIAADKLVAGYLETVGGQEDGDGGGNLDKLVGELAGSSSETLRFLRYVFDHDTSHKNKGTARLESLKSPSDQSDEKELEQAPDFFSDIELGSALQRACGAEVSNIIHPSSFYHYNSYKTIAKNASDLIAIRATKAEMRQFFTSGANGRLTPSGNLVKDVDELVDSLYEGIIPDESRQGVKSGEAGKKRMLPGDLKGLPALGSLTGHGKNVAAQRESA